MNLNKKLLGKRTRDEVQTQQSMPENMEFKSDDCALHIKGDQSILSIEQIKIADEARKSIFSLNESFTTAKNNK